MHAMHHCENLDYLFPNTICNDVTRRRNYHLASSNDSPLTPNEGKQFQPSNSFVDRVDYTVYPGRVAFV